MAKKQSSQAQDATREKAKALREAQERSDKRTKTTIIVMVVVVVAAIAAAIAFVLINRPTPEKAAADLPAQFQNGEPIIVSSEGIGTRNDGVGDLELYFDYTCGGCAQLDTSLRPYLFDGASGGDYNLLLQPVITSGHPYQYAATAGALMVAAEAPEKFVDFHESLVQFFYDSAVAQDSSVYDDLTKSTEKVAELATAVGVPQEVVDQFNTASAESYLKASTNTWVGAEIDGRTQTATPEFVTGGKQITLTASDAPAAIEELKTAVAASK